METRLLLHQGPRGPQGLSGPPGKSGRRVSPYDRHDAVRGLKEVLVKSLLEY